MFQIMELLPLTPTYVLNIWTDNVIPNGCV